MFFRVKRSHLHLPLSRTIGLLSCACVLLSSSWQSAVAVGGSRPVTQQRPNPTQQSPRTGTPARIGNQPQFAPGSNDQLNLTLDNQPVSVKLQFVSLVGKDDQLMEMGASQTQPDSSPSNSKQADTAVTAASGSKPDGALVTAPSDKSDGTNADSDSAATSKTGDSVAISPPSGNSSSTNPTNPTAPATGAASGQTGGRVQQDQQIIAGLVSQFGSNGRITRKDVTKALSDSSLTASQKAILEAIKSQMGSNDVTSYKETELNKLLNPISISKDEGKQISPFMQTILDETSPNQFETAAGKLFPNGTITEADVKSSLEKATKSGNTTQEALLKTILAYLKSQGVKSTTLTDVEGWSNLNQEYIMQVTSVAKQNFEQFLTGNFLLWTNEATDPKAELTLTRINALIANPDTPPISKQMLSQIKEHMDNKGIKEIDETQLKAWARTIGGADLRYEDYMSADTTNVNLANNAQLAKQDFRSIVSQFGSKDTLTQAQVTKALSNPNLTPTQEAVLQTLQSQMTPNTTYTLKQLDQLTDSSVDSKTGKQQPSTFMTDLSNNLQTQFQNALSPFFKNGSITQEQLAKDLKNPDITGSAAAALGVVAQYMRGTHDSTVSLSQFSQAGTWSRSFGHYQLALHTVSDPTSLWGKGNSGPEISKVQQQDIGDCYFVSSVEAIAEKDPQEIEKMIKPVKSGGQDVPGEYEVRFPGYKGGPILVTLTQGEMATLGNTTQDHGVWLFVLAKADSQVLRAPVSGKLPFANMSGGNQAKTLTCLTGKDYSFTEFQDSSEPNVKSMLIDALSDGTPIGIGTTDHDLSIESFDAKTDMLTIKNPWGITGLYTFPDGAVVSMKDGIFEMPLSKAMAVFYGISYPTKYDKILPAIASYNSERGTKESGSTIKDKEVAFANKESQNGKSAGSNADPSNESAETQSVESAKQAQGESDSEVLATRPLRAKDSLPDPLPTTASHGTIGMNSRDARWLFNRAQKSQTFPSTMVNGNTSAAAREVTLGQGSILVAADNSVQVHTRCGDVNVAGGSAAYILQVGDQVAIYNLCDDRKGGVQASLPGGYAKKVTVGNTVLLSKTTDGASNGNIQITGGKDLGTQGDINILNAQFRPTEVLTAVPQFQALMASKREQDKQLAERIAKMAAILATMEN